MSIHIGAERGEIAGRVLLPGDPLRAEYIAKRFLTDVRQYNKIRGMLGFTGKGPDGRQISVQGSGMGQDSLSIYVNELITDFGVKEIIRVGSCGALSSDVNLRDIILAQGACCDSNRNLRRFHGLSYAPLASWELLLQVYGAAAQLGLDVRIGNILSADLFYNDYDPQEWKLWASYGVLVVEMETAELYTLAAKAGIKALSILTVSDSVVTREGLLPEEREKTFDEMIELALAF